MPKATALPAIVRVTESGGFTGALRVFEIAASQLPPAMQTVLNGFLDHSPAAKIANQATTESAMRDGREILLEWCQFGSYSELKARHMQEKEFTEPLHALVACIRQNGYLVRK